MSAILKSFSSYPEMNDNSPFFQTKPLRLGHTSEFILCGPLRLTLRLSSSSSFFSCCGISWNIGEKKKWCSWPAETHQRWFRLWGGGGSQAGIQPPTNLLRHRVRKMTGQSWGQCPLTGQGLFFCSILPQQVTLVTLARHFLLSYLPKPTSQGQWLWMDLSTS